MRSSVTKGTRNLFYAVDKLARGWPKQGLGYFFWTGLTYARLVPKVHEILKPVSDEPQKVLGRFKTLLKVLANALDNPSDNKYRKVKRSAQLFQDYGFPAQKLLELAGWSDEGEIMLVELDVNGNLPLACVALHHLVCSYLLMLKQCDEDVLC